MARAWDGHSLSSSNPSTNEMEKVGDSQSSSEPVVPTSNEMMQRQKRVLKVEAESSEICLEKIKGVLEKLRETGDIDTWSEKTDGTVMVLGYFDPEKLRMELQNEAGDAIKSITDPTKTVVIGNEFLHHSLQLHG
ncbi:uncharacterized protein LOC141821453 [Curcuma longa]|uniref:uncharacterized protein LOC141821453 n=1 Tax=Curcuma longa TaxID=136217 RepID=UPI003D9E683F